MRYVGPARIAVLMAAVTLTLLMAFATDVIAEIVIDAPWQAVGLAALALTAITMAGSVISGMDQHSMDQQKDPRL